MGEVEMSRKISDDEHVVFVSWYIEKYLYSLIN
jgi:hypothetical protein